MTRSKEQAIINDYYCRMRFRQMFYLVFGVPLLLCILITIAGNAVKMHNSSGGTPQSAVVR
jgi:hypothetical protein